MILHGCVAPGPIDTDMIKNLGPDVVNAMIAVNPMKRLGTVDGVTELVLWLCSDACSFSTGAVFDISGGRGGLLTRHLIKSPHQRGRGAWARVSRDEPS
jgi:NAD(P)-dependent dehydrogenase (short-subunit alcohol dehydrogenase family)